MARINNHHIEYEPKEWIVELQQSHHRVISRIQHSKAKPDLYYLVTNMMHSLTYEWNRIRKELQVGGDLRIKNPKPTRKALAKMKAKEAAEKKKRQKI